MLSIRSANRLMVLAAAVMLQLSATICHAQSADGALENYPITLKVHQMAFMAAVKQLCVQAHCFISFDRHADQIIQGPNGYASSIVSGDFRKVPLRRALITLMRQSDLLCGLAVPAACAVWLRVSFMASLQD